MASWVKITIKMKIFTKLSICFLLLCLILGKETKLLAQWGDPNTPDYSNPIITTDCCPIAKQRLDSIVTNAPFVFEGRVIGMVYGSLYDSYLFEIEKVYKGGERLQAGTVELIVKGPGGSKFSFDEPPRAVFGYGWYIIFAKETEYPSSFEANNSVKLEIFYHDKFHTTSYFKEMRAQWCEPHFTSGLSLRFKTKEEVRDFIGSYGLFPTDIPKADTVKRLSKREIEETREKKEKNPYITGLRKRWILLKEK